MSLDLLLSAQTNGSLKVLRLKTNPGCSLVIVKEKAEFCQEGKKNYIQKIIVFKFQKKNYMAIARSSGLIQLYEDHVDQGTKVTNRQKNYKLFKEWKNSNNRSNDEIIAIGFINDQYLFSCSSEGKLIFRDLINDDADESYKVYLIEGPVATVQLLVITNDKFKVISAGKNNELKIYEVELSISSPNLLDSINQDIQILSSELRSTINLTYEPPDGRRLFRRASTGLNLRGAMPSRQKLCPKFISCSRQEDFIYKASPNDIITNWIISTCYLGEIQPGSTMVACGGQFGNLAIYDIKQGVYPVRTFHLSQFPINNLIPFNNNRYLLYSDTVSKIGIIDLQSFEIVNFYDNLKFGPMMNIKFVINNDLKKVSKSNHVSKFDPIYLISSTIDKRLIMYKLFDDNTTEVKIDVQLDIIIPSIEILDNNPYIALTNLFSRPTHDAEEVEEEYLFGHDGFSRKPVSSWSKKRRISSPIKFFPQPLTGASQFGQSSAPQEKDPKLMLDKKENFGVKIM